MKLLILAAGYGTRLQQDLQRHPEYKHLLHLPKALLPIGGKPLISHWIHQWSGSLQDVFLVTNAHFYTQLLDWASPLGIPSQHIINDGTLSNQDRLGAIADIQFAMDFCHLGSDAPMLIVAGDTLMLHDFQLEMVLGEFEKHPDWDGLVLYYQCDEEETKRTGILDVDLTSKQVCGFLEKPTASETTLRNACPCFYLLRPSALKQISIFLEEMKNRPLAEWDATGKLLQWLYPRARIHALPISGRLDVGHLPSYLEADAYMHESHSRSK
jgi:NDP-sugar pyrophosphorylase family protein